MNFLGEIKKRVLVYDGSKGYLLQKLGLKGGDCPELWNVERRDEIKKIYAAYRDAGADVIQTNTFQGNRLQLERYNLGDRTYELNYESTRLAKEVMGDKGFVAASIGPIGRLFEPSGDLTFNLAYETYKEQVIAVAEGGADIINFETFTDVADMRAALIAAKDCTDLPVICSMAFEQNGKTLMGSDPYLAAIVLKSLGADMIGVNCSFGPEHMIDIVKEMARQGDIYLSVKPNAGLPEMIDGEIIYKQNPDEFANLLIEFTDLGARLIGGCCGTTPDFIKKIKEKIVKSEMREMPSENRELITSSTKVIDVSNLHKFKIGYLSCSKDLELLHALENNDMDEATDSIMEFLGSDYDLIYINIDLAKGESNLLGRVLDIAQGYIRQPFIIETIDPKALELALRLYRGKAGVIIKSELDKSNSLKNIAEKYGSSILEFCENQSFKNY